MSTTVKLAAVLAAVAIGLTGCGEEASDGEGSGGEGSGGGGTALTVEAYDFRFEAEGDALPEGGDVTVTLINEGEAPHTFSSADLDVNVEAAPGAEGEGTFTMPESGSVEFQCDIHPDQMKLTLTAGEAPPAESDAGGAGSDDTKDDSKDDTGGDDDYDY
jgi:plastocyanin